MRSIQALSVEGIEKLYIGAPITTTSASRNCCSACSDSSDRAGSALTRRLPPEGGGDWESGQQTGRVIPDHWPPHRGRRAPGTPRQRDLPPRGRKLLGNPHMQ